ncbi:6-pyruvoyl trahydropterin synthase family protein [Picrophilus oshimae]|uniref:6-pyruvoyltetrahydrobiopterin synthase n=1 Tax=Picrophilus torridus (strain ATCC 700027 / DSM 9790 / JCM 10055 / NBRC 100828 / KAW 2/3) TaxID=1122961 RepID=Q6L053_PICTO|nr:6-carboxytetrahydropterin synthase [Picrophilus oshimae]AAT43649.1 6-pyruvoyltetrahydrobiopterin synthase [Picrophilus oshimae DSM 9789]SMD31274.1 6-pyruvoyltetrahydropterin/6-carboxytetrahydropterin synthase [Picrophilus oshimae DSM 9789]
MWLEIDGKTRGLHWSAAHIIPGHPKCGRLHGHDYILNIRLYFDENNSLKTRGYEIDYGDIKRAAKAIIERMDHHFMVPEDAIEDNGKIHYNNITVSADQVCRIPVPVVSSENLAIYIKSELNRYFSEYKIECGVFEGEGQGAWA